MGRVKVAVVGCGDISGRHLAAFRNYAAQAQVAVCCDTDLERAQQAAEQTGADEDSTEDGQGVERARAVTDFAEILADPEIQAVDLCLPHHLHAPFTIAAAEAGKHILCEKPLALTVEECDRMISAARAAGVVLAHGEPFRTAGNISQAAQIIQEGRIGKLVGLQATFAYWQRAELNREWRGRKSESGGGHLMDGGIHAIDALRHLGGTVTGVQAMTGSFRPELGADSEDLACLNLRFESGCFGQLFACHAVRGRGASPLLTAFGNAGVLSLEAYGSGNSLVLFLPGQPPEVLTQTPGWNNGYERLIGNFLEVVLTGAPLRATPEDGRENVRIVLAAYESARTRCEVALGS